jgi:hypothetical protein
VSRCSTVDGQLLFEGTVALAGQELSVKISAGKDASIEIVDVGANKTWTAPAADDPEATVSVQATTATSGSVAAIASAATSTHLNVRGTYGC